MSDVVRPPSGWTLYHSVAFLLVTASCIDGDVDSEELDTIRTRLAQYPDLADGSADDVLKSSAAYYERMRKEGAVMTALDQHCSRLAKALTDPEARKVVLDDLIAVVGADAELHEHERSFLEAVYQHFGLELPS